MRWLCLYLYIKETIRKKSPNIQYNLQYNIQYIIKYKVSKKEFKKLNVISNFHYFYHFLWGYCYSFQSLSFSIYLSRGNAITYWILYCPVNIIISLSRPIPHPAHGIKPYSKAFTKSRSLGVFYFCVRGSLSYV